MDAFFEKALGPATKSRACRGEGGGRRVRLYRPKAWLTALCMSCGSWRLPMASLACCMLSPIAACMATHDLLTQFGIRAWQTADSIHSIYQSLAQHCMCLVVYLRSKGVTWSMVCQQMPCSTVVCTPHNSMCCHITWHSSAIQHSTTQQADLVHVAVHKHQAFMPSLAMRVCKTST